MKRKIQRIICFLIAFVLIVSQVPPLAFAIETDEISFEDFEGKKVSILGDSISTYDGVSNNISYNSTIGGNYVYYHGDGVVAGVRLNDTWWQQVIDAMGMELCVNNSFSGSCFSIYRYGPAAYIDRCVQLHNNEGEDPDYIWIYMGTNDFGTRELPWGTGAEIDTDTLFVKNSGGAYTYSDPQTVCEAYAIMLHKAAMRYPDAQIYCMGMLTRDYTIAELTNANNEMEAVAKLLGIPFIELESITATYEDYCISMGDSLHPNKEGMDRISQRVINAMMGKENHKELDVYDITYKLTNVQSSNDAKLSFEGGKYATTLSAKNGDIINCEVMMGGIDITEDCYKDGKITISNVTGDITIIAGAADITDTRDDGVINYVSLGASNVNGYGLRGYIQGGDSIMDAAALDWTIKAGANVLGYGSAATESYPVRIAKALGAKLDQMAISSMRVEELRILLDNDYYGDSYSDWRFVGDGKWFDIATAHTGGVGGIAELRADYQSKIANADFVTVDIGANNFGVYISHQLTSNHSYDNDIALTDPELAEDYEAGKAYVKELVAEYAPQFSPMLEGYDELIDTMTYALVGFCINFDIVMEKIYELNPDATVVAVSIQNLMDGFQVRVPGIDGVLPLGDIFGALVNAANIYIAVGSPYSDKYLCADVRKDGRVEFFLEDLIAYNGDPSTLDINILDCFNIYDGSPGRTYDSGIHVKYLLNKETNGQYTDAMLNAAYDAVASILQAAAKVEVIDMAVLSGNDAAEDALAAAFKQEIMAAVTAAANGQTDYVLPENFFAALAAEANVPVSALESVAAIYVRTDMGNSFFGHPNPDGHKEILNAIFSTIELGTSGKDIMADELIIAFEQLNAFIENELEADYENQGLFYDVLHGEYEVSSDSYYVSLGDSTVIGMNADNGKNHGGYDEYGYKTVVPASYPYKLAEKLGLDAETQYIQLALAGVRTNDLRYLLDENFTPDAYTTDIVMQRINTYAGGLEKVRADYKEALAKADLVTLSVGSCNISDFISTQVSGMVAELLRSNETLTNLLNSNMGAQIKPMLNGFFDIDAPYYDMDWDSYLGADGMEIIDTILEEVKSLLRENDVPETLTLDVGEMLQPMLDEQFGKGLVTVDIKLDIPVYELASDVVELCMYGYVTHAFSYGEVVDKIHELTDAHVVLLSMYNPQDNLVISLDGTEIPVGVYIGYVYGAMSANGFIAAMLNENTTFVPIYDVESNFDRVMDEEGNVYELLDYLTGVADGTADNHATAEGHTYMAEQVYNALTVTNGDGSHDNCVADIFSDIKAEAWYHDSICYVYNENLMKGMSDDKFSPSTATSRAMIVTTLYRMEGSPAVSAENSFDDVKDGAWYADAITWASENGIVNGLGNGLFGPNNDVTREQIAAMLYRYAEYKGMDVSAKATLEGFTDVDQIHSWALDAMKWANAAKLINGRTETTINPLNNTMRSELATLLYRWCTEISE